MGSPFFSIATISFNQAPFLGPAIESVLGQDFHDYEYIVQDPGSTDGSREIISSYSSRISASFEPDQGPADGLNKAFSRAKGKYFLFLNSDDMLMPDSLAKLYKWINSDDHRHHVYSGACSVIDTRGRHLRYAYSDAMNLMMAAYGQCILIQPSSAISAMAFRAVDGFNALNRSNWDGELFIDLALNGCQFARSCHALSCYRVHAASITGSGSLYAQQAEERRRLFTKITSKSYNERSRILADFYWLKRKLANPLDTIERLLGGPIYGSCG
ncbi:glycosyltransferase [Cyanobium sp. FGCU-6]|nr:glycosyltransferase [Cyanobium sp. FGCU6]